MHLEQSVPLCPIGFFFVKLSIPTFGMYRYMSKQERERERDRHTERIVIAT